MTPNDDGLDQCPVCGTGTMMKQYFVRFTVEVPVAEFSELEAVERALAIANGDIVTHIVGMQVGTQDNEGNETWNEN